MAARIKLLNQKRTEWDKEKNEIWENEINRAFWNSIGEHFCYVNNLNWRHSMHCRLKHRTCIKIHWAIQYLSVLSYFALAVARCDIATLSLAYLLISRTNRRLDDGVALRSLQVILSKCLGIDGPCPGSSHDQHLRAGHKSAEPVTKP